jgi:xylulokinase
MNPLIVGLDLGTSLCKASAFELDGRLVESAQKGITTFRPRPGWAEQDPLEWRQAIIDVLAGLVAKLGKQAGRVRAIGLSNHGPSVIATDKNFRPMGRCSIWQDQRASDLLDPLIQLAGEDWIGLGTPESSFGVQLYWTILNRPELLEEAAHLFDVKGYLLAILTGRAVDEPSSSPGGEGANQALFDALSVDLDRLPESTPSLSVVGPLTPEIQNSADLPSPIQIVAGLNDGAAATLGAGIVELGQGIVSLSTNGVMRATIPQRLPGKILRAKSMFCYSYVDDMYVTGGMTKCGGDSVRWLVENFYPDRADDPSVFDQIASEAAHSPVGANGVIFMPYLVGMGTPNPTKVAQAAFLNLGRGHTRADLTRALLEGAAFALKDIGETFDELGLGWENLSFTGGGSKNPTWRQIVSDILGKPLSGARSDSVLGVAMLAATSIGLFKDIQDAVQNMVSKSFSVAPLEENVASYNRIYARFKRLKAFLAEMTENQD